MAFERRDDIGGRCGRKRGLEIVGLTGIVKSEILIHLSLHSRGAFGGDGSLPKARTERSFAHAKLSAGLTGSVARLRSCQPQLDQSMAEEQEKEDEEKEEGRG